MNHKEALSKRSQGRKDYSESENWYQLNRPREKWIYDSIKIIYPGTTNTPRFAFDSLNQVFRNARLYAFLLNDGREASYKVVLAILNSKLSHYLMSILCPPKAGGYFEMSTGFLDKFPFMFPKNNELLLEKTNEIIKVKENLYKITNSLLILLQSKFNIQNPSKKLQDWYDLSFEDFIKELKKEKVQFSLSEESEWIHYFNEQKQKAQSLKTEFDRTDRQINQLIYQLYELTPEEIAIVESQS